MDISYCIASVGSVFCVQPAFGEGGANGCYHHNYGGLF